MEHVSYSHWPEFLARQRTEETLWSWAIMTRWPSTNWATWMVTVVMAKQQERLSCFLQETHLSLHWHTVWLKRCGPGRQSTNLSQLLPWVVGWSGARTGWSKSIFPTRSSGMRYAPCCNLFLRPPQIAGEMPHDWLRQIADYHAKDEGLKDMCTRLQQDRGQCQEMQNVLPSCKGWDLFIEAWTNDLILASRQQMRD